MFRQVTRPVKFSTQTLGDAWYLRTVFVGSCDSVASYKFWFPESERKVRGSDIRYKTDFRFGFEI